MESRRQRRTGGLSKQAWIVTFTDLLALILAFFVLLFAMSQIKLQAWDAFVEALTDRLNPRDEWHVPALLLEQQAERVLAERAVNLDYLRAILEEKVEADPLLKQAVVHHLGNRLVVSLPGDAMFREGGATLTEAARDALLLLGDALQFVGNQIDIVGHGLPPSLGEDAPAARSWMVSLSRALSVADLISSAGYVDQPRVVGLGDGRYYELDPGLSSSLRRRLGTRVDIVIHEAPAVGGGHAG